MNPCTNDYKHYVYGFGHLCFTLLINSTRITYDNYNTTRISENFKLFAITLQILHWIFVQLLNY
jgi:hypothetical protein